MDPIEPAGPSPAQPHPYPPPPPPLSSLSSIPDHPNFSPYSQPGQDTLTAMQFNSARNYNETTPLLNLSNNNYNIEHIPPDLVSINAPGDNVATSSKYNKVSGKYVEVPNYPSNRTFNNNGQLTASKTTINVVLLVVMFQSVGFTLVLPSMYLYLKSLNGRDAFYGWIVAIYSVGSLLGSVLFGKWSDLRTPKEAIIGGTIVAIIGNIFYVAIGFFPEKDGEWLMLTARFLVGFGSGCVAVCRAFCSETTDVKNKTSMMAAVSGSQGIGFVIGPALGSVLSKLNFTIKKAVINEFTSPGYLSAILCLFSGILVLFLMPAMSPRKGAKQTITQSTDEPQLPVYITLFLFFSSISVFAIFETDFTLLSQRDFGWGAEKNSIYFLVAAVISTVVFALIGTPWAKKQDERIAAAFGQVILILGMLAFIVYDKPVHLEDRLSLGQLFAGGVIFSIGYPISSTYIFGMYAKILNPRIQGAKMGFITASGSLARMLGPIWASSALAVSDALVFGGTALFLVISLIVLFFSRKKLLPHRDYGKEIPK